MKKMEKEGTAEKVVSKVKVAEDAKDAVEALLKVLKNMLQRRKIRLKVS